MNGVLGSKLLTAGAFQSIYCCGFSDGAVVTLNLCNRGNATATVKLAITATANTPLDTEWIEYDVSLIAKGILERNGIVISNGQYLTVWTDSNYITAMCWGAEVGTELTVPSISTSYGPIWVTAAALPTVTSSTVSIQLSATDSNSASLTYTLINGSLPSGLTVSSTGLISGTLTETTTTTRVFSIRVSDGVNFIDRTFSMPVFLAMAFTISPAVSGKSTWNVGIDGPLVLSTPGTWTITPTAPASYNITMWGAGGGAGNDEGVDRITYHAGGGGGYSFASVNTAANSSYVLVVGAGGRGGRRSSIANRATVSLGGGAGGYRDTNSLGGGGGGASGVFLTSVTQANAILVAAGGGGGSSSWGDNYAAGGAGGGTAGTAGAGTYGGGGGTQSAGGAAGTNASFGYGSVSGTQAGSALTGGDGGSATGSGPAGGGGGGGGYYGGGAGGGVTDTNAGGGGGGSGYAHATLATLSVLTGGSGATPGNSAHASRGTAGNGGNAYNSGSTDDGEDGYPGKIIIS